MSIAEEREYADKCFRAAEIAARVARERIRLGTAIHCDSRLSDAEWTARQLAINEHNDTVHPDGSACHHGRREEQR